MLVYVGWTGRLPVAPLRESTRVVQDDQGVEMSSEAPADDPKYDIWIEDTIPAWDKSTISLPEIRELGGLPADCPVLAVDLVEQQEVPLPEDSVHEIPPREAGRPLVKRTQFKRIS